MIYLTILIIFKTWSKYFRVLFILSYIGPWRISFFNLFRQKFSMFFFFCWKVSSGRYVGNVSQNIRGLRLLKPIMRGPKCVRVIGGGGGVVIEFVFTNFGKFFYFFVFVLKNNPQECERCVPTRKHPNMQPKGHGGRGIE